MTYRPSAQVEVEVDAVFGIPATTVLVVDSAIVDEAGFDLSTVTSLLPRFAEYHAAFNGRQTVTVGAQACA